MQSITATQDDSLLRTERGTAHPVESRKARPSFARWVAGLALAPPDHLHRLLAGLTIRAGERVLDLGCADATLLVPLARRFPRARFVGLDPDAGDLEIARAHIEAAGLAVELHRGLIFAPPFTPSTFHCIVSAQLLHRSTIREKVLAISAAYRLLKPGGTFYMIDWGQPQGCVARALFMARRLARGHTLAPPPVDRLLLAMMRNTGFERVTIDDQQRTPWGTVCLFSGRRPHETCVSR